MSDKIVVGTDGSETAQRAVMRRAAGPGTGTGSCMWSRLQGAPRGQDPHAPAGAAKVWAPLPDSLAQAGPSTQAAQSSKRPGSGSEPHLLEEDPGDALLEVAKQVGPSMIVVGNRGMAAPGGSWAASPTRFLTRRGATC